MDERLEVRPAPIRREGAPALARRPRGWLTPAIALLLLILFGLASWRLLHSASTVQRADAVPLSVGIAAVTTGDIAVVLTGLGAVTPLATVTVKTQINGQLQQIGFTEGQFVHKGDFLAQIDPRPYQVALEKDQGTLAHDTGLLNQARADNARYQTLSKQDSISRQQVEDQVYLIKQYEGSVLADQGTIDTDKLNLLYCRITSPVDGRVGIRLVDPGNFVQTTDTSGLFVVTQVQPISVVFTLPEDDLAQVRQRMAAGPLQVQAYDRTNTQLVATGTLATLDNQIDNTTGTVKLRALFPNADDVLFPQAFVNARLLVNTHKNVMVVPQAAIQSGSPGEFVYVVRPDDTVAIQIIQTGASDGGRIEVVKGLKPGDRVVTDGLDRLIDGVRIMDASRPQAAATLAVPAAR